MPFHFAIETIKIVIENVIIEIKTQINKSSIRYQSVERVIHLDKLNFAKKQKETEK